MGYPEAGIKWKWLEIKISEGYLYLTEIRTHRGENRL